MTNWQTTFGGRATWFAPAATLATGLLLAAGCGELEPGAEVPVRLAGTSYAGSAAFELDEARVTVTSVELEPCPTLAASVWNALMPSAYAHVDATPTRLGTPLVLDALDPGTFRMGTFTPPSGRYCSVYVLITPADDDALLVDDRTLGRSLTIRGSRAGEAFDRTTALSYDRTFPLDPPLVAGDEASLLATFDPGAWFADPEALPWDDEFLLAQEVVVRALDTLELSVVRAEETP